MMRKPTAGARLLDKALQTHDDQLYKLTVLYFSDYASVAAEVLHALSGTIHEKVSIPNELLRDIGYF